MNIILQARHTRYPHSVSTLLEESLLALGERCRAEEAMVRLTDAREASPRFEVVISLRLPGPDLHVSGCDHTIAVAARKALRALEAQLESRAGRREQRRRSNLQVPATARTGRSW